MGHYCVNMCIIAHIDCRSRPSAKWNLQNTKPTGSKNRNSLCSLNVHFLIACHYWPSALSILIILSLLSFLIRLVAVLGISGSLSCLVLARQRHACCHYVNPVHIQIFQNGTPNHPNLFLHYYMLGIVNVILVHAQKEIYHGKEWTSSLLSMRIPQRKRSSIPPPPKAVVKSILLQSQTEKKSLQLSSFFSFAQATRSSTETKPWYERDRYSSWQYTNMKISTSNQTRLKNARLSSLFLLGGSCVQKVLISLAQLVIISFRRWSNWYTIIFGKGVFQDLSRLKR